MRRRPASASAPAPLALGALAAALAGAGCGGAPGTATQSASSVTLRLQGLPAGTATLTWDARSKRLGLALDAHGLIPGATYAAALRTGDCLSAAGAVVVAFAPASAGSDGALRATPAGSPATLPKGPGPGTYLELHAAAGPASSVVTCTDVRSGGARVALALFAPPGRKPAGAVTLTGPDAGGRLTVHVAASYMAPGSAHAVRVHQGSCAAQGPVLYDLGDIAADGTGATDQTLGVDGVGAPPPATGWDVELLAGAAAEASSGPQGAAAEPMLCGDLAG